MADEDTNISPAGKAADLSSEAANTGPSITDADNAPSITDADTGTSTTAAEGDDVIATPPAPAKAGKYEELHSEPHPHVRWHADVLADGHVYQDLVKDVSMQGANLFLEHNLQNTRLIKLHIHVPPLIVTSHPHILGVSAKILSTIYDGSEDSFRSSISFLKFALKTDKEYLHSRIG